jgi:hypothetical protein
MLACTRADKKGSCFTPLLDLDSLTQMYSSFRSQIYIKNHVELHDPS